MFETESVRRTAGVAALLALAALLVGGISLSIVGTPRSGAALVGAITDSPWPYVAGGVGLAFVSLFDMFTVPALHATLAGYGRVLVLVATGTALVGDLLGVLGRLAQTAVVPSAIGSGTSAEGLAALSVLNVLDATLNTAGFVLVSVSFSCFGVLMRRRLSRVLGWTAIAAGVLTLAGQLPGLQGLFYLANVAFIVWYVGLAILFLRVPSRGADTQAETSSCTASMAAAEVAHE